MEINKLIFSLIKISVLSFTVWYLYNDTKKRMNHSTVVEEKEK
jgi:hypothetical protein